MGLTSGLLLLAKGVDSASGLRQGGSEHVCSAKQRSLEGTCELREQDLSGFEVCQLHNFCWRNGGAIEVATLDHQRGVVLGKVTQALRNSDGVAVHKCESRGANEHAIERVDARFFGRNLGQRVLHYGIGSV